MLNKFMLIALDEAHAALRRGEVPVGAIIVREGEIIARGHNRRQTTRDATRHAEIEAIRAACEKLGDWRLADCDIYVTLEPCVMCAGAIINARMKRLYFGSYDPAYGGAGGRIDLFAQSFFGAKVEVFAGIMQEECDRLINGFFASLRKQ